MQFDIFGSCISRDPFEFKSCNHSPGKYIARSSLVSAIQTEKFKRSYTVDLGNAFKNRCLDDDLLKQFPGYAKETKSEMIVIDLIQERYGVNSLDGNYFTFSQDYRKMKLPVGEIIRYDNHFKLFEDNIVRIAEVLSQYKKIIVHEAYLCPTFHKNNGDIGILPINETDEYFMENGSKYYNLIKKFVPNTFSLRIDGYIGTEKHKWGPGKAHYEDEYQNRFNEGLDYILDNNENYYFIKNYGVLKDHVVR